MTVFENFKKEDVEKLLRKGFKMDTPKTLYEEYRLTKKGVAVIFYNSGKLFIQGKNADGIADEIRRLHLGDEVKKTIFRRESGWIIGSDETLKGDTFGGLVVAGVKADNKIREQLKEIGVDDSKKLSDGEIINMAEKIKKIAPCEVRSIYPEEYNRGEGITELLNRLHCECAKYLHPGKHVVDKYPGCKVGDIMEEKKHTCNN